MVPYLLPKGYTNKYRLIRIAFLYVLWSQSPVYVVPGLPQAVYFVESRRAFVLKRYVSDKQPIGLVMFADCGYV